MTIRVFLADDHPLTRAGLRDYIAKEKDLELVGEASDGLEAWKIIEREKPDVALLDIRMPGENGVSLARRIKGSSLPVVPVMLTSFDAQQYVMASLRAGARGYILKTVTPEELSRAIRVVAREVFTWIERWHGASRTAIQPSRHCRRGRGRSSSTQPGVSPARRSPEFS